MEMFLTMNGDRSHLHFQMIKWNHDIQQNDDKPNAISSFFSLFLKFTSDNLQFTSVNF